MRWVGLVILITLVTAATVAIVMTFATGGLDLFH
jgi:hypothetical protein